MNLKEIFTTSFNMFFKWRKAKLAKSLIELSDKYLQSQARVNQLEEEITQLKEKLEQEKIKATNKQVNKPSSKQAECEKGSSKDKAKEKRKRRNRKPRKGAGNPPKNLRPNQTATASVEKSGYIRISQLV